MTTKAATLMMELDLLLPRLCRLLQQQTRHGGLLLLLLGYLGDRPYVGIAAVLVAAAAAAVVGSTYLVPCC
jgi:hypothetical protein